MSPHVMLSDIQNLSISNEYKGLDHLIIGKGNGSPIKHVAFLLYQFDIENSL